jgi:hypothetical protein
MKMHEMISVEQDESGHHRFECLFCSRVILYSPDSGMSSPFTVIETGEEHIRHMGAIGPVTMSAEIDDSL